MAKHPHRLMLFDGRTWKCTLDGCAFFVHLGLAHVLMGKRAICWECGEIFTIDERALKDAQPKCDECRLSGNTGTVSASQQNDILEWKMAQAKAAKNKLIGDPEDKQSLHKITCSIHFGSSCDCGIE